MIDVPALTPVTIPEVPTVAFVVLLLLHDPPPASLRVVVAYWHTLGVPPIGEGSAITVTVVVMLQPEETEYDIVAVPADTPQATPVPETVATDAEALCHVPPSVPSASDMQDPGHTRDGPVMGSGNGIMVTVSAALGLRHPAIVCET